MHCIGGLQLVAVICAEVLIALCLPNIFFNTCIDKLILWVCPCICLCLLVSYHNCFSSWYNEPLERKAFGNFFSWNSWNHALQVTMLQYLGNLSLYQYYQFQRTLLAVSYNSIFLVFIFKQTLYFKAKSDCFTTVWSRLTLYLMTGQLLRSMSLCMKRTTEDHFLVVVLVNCNYCNYFLRKSIWASGSEQATSSFWLVFKEKWLSLSKNNRFRRVNEINPFRGLMSTQRNGAGRTIHENATRPTVSLKQM